MAAIYELLQRLGISGRYRGFRYLAYAVFLTLQSKDHDLLLTKELYPGVAKHYKTTWRCVERNIRTVVKVCWERGNRSLLNELARFPQEQPPCTGQFIEILAMYLAAKEDFSVSVPECPPDGREHIPSSPLL